MKPFENETELTTALREMRPTPEPEFAAELDARAAAGFPRDSRWGAALARLRERVAFTPPRRLLAPAGGLALAAVVIATAVVATTESGSPTSSSPISQAPSAAAPAAKPALPDAGTTKGSSGTAYSYESQGSEAGAAATSGGSEIQRSASPPAPTTGPYAADAGRRDIERSADVVLGADPGDVRGDAAKVFDAVHAVDGIVLSSSIRDGEAGVAGADFELLIPSTKLGDALADFSAIGEVRSRHEATQDITAPSVRVGEQLRDSRARIEGLLGQLADAHTDAERAAVEAQLRSERRRAAALRSRQSSLSRRANLSRVSLRIETGNGSASGDGSSTGWGIGDGLDDAGRILAVGAGVTVIGLAILAPLALLALLAWLCRRAWIRRARREALGRA